MDVCGASSDRTFPGLATFVDVQTEAPKSYRVQTLRNHLINNTTADDWQCQLCLNGNIY
jgi:hypothetical protein